jgi:hypothetical protein
MDKGAVILDGPGPAHAEAAAEYQCYLREFPKGRYIREAKAALLP